MDIGIDIETFDLVTRSQIRQLETLIHRLYLETIGDFGFMYNLETKELTFVANPEKYSIKLIRSMFKIRSLIRDPYFYNKEKSEEEPKKPDIDFSKVNVEKFIERRRLHIKRLKCIIEDIDKANNLSIGFTYYLATDDFKITEPYNSIAKKFDERNKKIHELVKRSKRIKHL